MRPNKLLFVDSMRGWAILMVIVCHQAQAFHHLPAPAKLLTSYMQTGVFLFFIASAFTLCNSAILRGDEPNTTRNFFMRRLFRVAPLYYVGIALFWVMATYQPHLVKGYLGTPTTTSLAANILLLHGFLPSTFEGVVPGGWSIGTEWAFYLLFPMLFPACCWVRERWGWQALLLPLVALAALPATLMTHVALSNSVYWFWYDSIVNQLPVFMIGVILFLAVRDGAFSPDLRRDVPAFLIAGALGIYLLSIHLFAALPLISAISFTFLFNILRVGSTSYCLIERIGRASYSMYVFHTLFAVCATRVVLKDFAVPQSWECAAFVAACLITITATYVTGRISEKLIEHPFITLGRRLTA